MIGSFATTGDDVKQDIFTEGVHRYTPLALQLLPDAAISVVARLDG